MDEIIEDLDEYGDHSRADEQSKTTDNDTSDAIIGRVKPVAATGLVLCVASRSPLDQTAASMLAQVLTKRGASAVSMPFERVGFETLLTPDARAAKLVCLSYFGVAAKPAHVRYVIRRLRRLMPKAKFLACFWMLRDDRTKLEEWKTSVNAEFAASAIEEAANICSAEMRLLIPNETRPTELKVIADREHAAAAASA
jgi:hypothetical protein